MNNGNTTPTTLPLEVVSEAMEVDPASVRRPGKKRASAAVRGIICHLAIFEFGYSGSEVGRVLHLGSSCVSLAARRGEKLVNVDPTILEQIRSPIEK